MENMEGSLHQFPSLQKLVWTMFHVPPSGTTTGQNSSVPFVGLKIHTYIYVYILQNWRINNIEPAERVFSYHLSCPFYRVPIARLAAAQVAV